METKIYTIIRIFILTFITTICLAQPVVTYPNGGEILTVGSTVTITWSGTALGQVVGIDYTTNNWTTTTWLTTSYSNATANSYTWVVPNTPGIQCKIGVFNTSFAGDVSNSFFTISPATSVQEETAEPDFSIYPNPSEGKFEVSGLPAEGQFGPQAGLKFQVGEVEIYNLLGEKVFYSTIESSTHSVIDISSQPNGIYFIEVRTDEKTYYKKLIISAE